jgi:hypothetical protein
MAVSTWSKNVKVVSMRKLEIPKARELARLLQKPGIPFAKLLRCRRTTDGSSEMVELEVQVEVGQKTVHDIRKVEPIAVTFSADDRNRPEVLALREDFPTDTPHQNIRTFSRPRSLCLYEEPWPEIRLRWSVTWFLERIREWLRLTARGELHDVGQPLEQLLSAPEGTLILPYCLVDGCQPGDLTKVNVEILNAAKKAPVFRVRIAASPISQADPPRAIATVVTTGLIQHGAIRSQPTNLQELHSLCMEANTDLVAELRGRIREWIIKKPQGDVSNAQLLLIVAFQKTRIPRGPVEQREVWSFCIPQTVHDVAIALGVEDKQKGMTGYIIGEGSAADGVSKASEIAIGQLQTVYTLTPASAALFNGFKDADVTKVLGIGMGAIGSQVFNNLFRSGFGEWTLVDNDILLPHNCARHELSGGYVGHNKAMGLAHFANATIEDSVPVKWIAADVLQPGAEKDSLNAALAAAGLILDFSASLAVARYLSAIRSDARRISVFLNPAGNDLVMLVEDKKREFTLTLLEMEYYRLVATETALSRHLSDGVVRIRYSRSCGDISSTMDQSVVAMQAAVASSSVRTLLDQDRPSITVSRYSAGTGSLNRFSYELPRYTLERCGDWTVCVSALALDKVHRFRNEKLPLETGGVLVGAFDRLNRFLYVVDIIGSPADSTEWPALYIRGTHGLRKQLAAIEASTLSNLEYAGEWHSHPTGCTVKPSGTDMQALKHLAEEMHVEGVPAAMLIVGDSDRHGVFLCS